MHNKKHRLLFLETLESRIVLTGPAVDVSDLVSWYRAEGNAGDSADGNNGAFVDSGGIVDPTTVGIDPGRHLTAAGSFTVLEGRVGKAFYFNSSSTHVEIPNSPSLQLQTFTIDAWVKSFYPGSFGDVKGGEIVGKALPSQGSGISVSILGPGNSGHFTFAASLSDGSQPVFTSSNSFGDGQWHHVAMTCDGSTILGYVDGLQVAGSIPLGSESILADPAAPWTIGGHPDAGLYGQHYYEGMIDEVGFYQRGLTAGEVQSLYNQTANTTPIANDNAWSVDENQELNVSVTGVLANDVDATGGNTLSAVLVAGPSHGDLTLNANGSFTYIPVVNYCGSDCYTYKANDGTVDSNLATVNITVLPVIPTNNAPVAADDAYSTAEDAALTVAAPGILANDTDADSDPLTSILVTGPSHGLLTQNADGSFTYTPAANYSGPDSYTYKANDGTADSNVATVNITVTPVNDAPVAVDDTYSTYENTALTVGTPGILANDSDVEGSPLTSILVTGPSHGSLTQNADGSFTYTPAVNYSGPDSYTYKANDGTADSNTATVNITVTPSVHMLPDPDRFGMTMLVIDGTSGNDIFTLAPTANAGEYRLNLNGFNLGAYSPTGSVQIYGNGGSDTAVLNGSSSPNAFEVHSDCLVLNTLPFFDHAVAARQINALGSGDMISVFGGSATINGGAASDTLVATGVISHDWQITAQNTGSLDGLVFFSSVEQLVGGAGADTFHLGISGRITGSVDGGGGSDLFIAPDSANTWTVSSASGGTVKNTDFNGFETLRGGSAADTFRITPGIAFAGALEGGGGTDLLDYSAYATAVTVDLLAGTATGAGGVSGFENITGGDGNDFLVGNAADNDISGGIGDDIILGWSGNDTLSGGAGLDIAVGGSGADTVHGNNMDDILVAASLTYANESTSSINRAALDAIMAEWHRALAYSLRIDHLSVNPSDGLNSGYMLNASTLLDDGATDTLFGDAGQDWFLAGINDVVKTTKGETVTT
jgi:VCBS repeat-containing protein